MDVLESNEQEFFLLRAVFAKHEPTRFAASFKMSRIVFVPAVMALLLVVGRLGAASDEEFVRGILKTSCVRCHGEKKAKADVALHALTIGRIQANEVLTWKRFTKSSRTAPCRPRTKINQLPRIASDC